jgi:hypothetical protein
MNGEKTPQVGNFQDHYGSVSALAKKRERRIDMEPEKNEG